jgi:hypothetical protein
MSTLFPAWLFGKFDEHATLQLCELTMDTVTLNGVLKSLGVCADQGGKTVTLLEPFFHNVCVSWQNKVKILFLMQSFSFSPLKIAHVEMLQLH